MDDRLEAAIRDLAPGHDGPIRDTQTGAEILAAIVAFGRGAIGEIEAAAQAVEIAAETPRATEAAIAACSAAIYTTDEDGEAAEIEAARNATHAALRLAVLIRDS